MPLTGIWIVFQKTKKTNKMSIEERATKYSIEMYGLEDAYKSSITNGLIAAQGYKRGAEDEKRILTNKAWKYLTGKLKPAVLGTNGLVVLEGGINEEEFKKLMMEE